MSINMNEGRNKKLLVPVIALLLCATALIGAGYAASVSKAINTGNEVDGIVINLTLSNGKEGDAYSEGVGAIAGDAKIEYNQVKVDGTERFYVEKKTEVGSGTLTVDLENYSGSFKISTDYKIYKDFNKKLSLNIVLEDKDGKAVTNNDTITVNDAVTATYTFKIYAVFESVKVTGDYFKLPDDPDKIYSWLADNLDDNTTDGKLSDIDYIKDGFKYDVIFTVEAVAPSSP